MQLKRSLKTWLWPGDLSFCPIYEFLYQMSQVLPQSKQVQILVSRLIAVLSWLVNTFSAKIYMRYSYFEIMH